ncbi:MAG: hypothetical protein NTX97_02765 [Bacteroidetes bacterium]|nr:hypothetical protein [Bacteroidota bacterium]
MKYPETAIQGLINALDDDQEAYVWLSESKWKELAAFVDIVNSENTQALQFLLSNKEKFPTIVNFLAALQKEEKAFDLLMATNDREWAATVSSVHGDDEAYEWLLKNNFIIFTKLVDVLVKNTSSRGSGISSFGGIGGGSSGGGGFGGFGGGSFGGGGGGGSW